MGPGVTYILFLELPEPGWIGVGSLGDVYFRDGVYVYVGRARANPEARIRRHILGLGKRRWHIDSLREHAEPLGLILMPGAWWESVVASYLSEVYLPIPGFGGTDIGSSTLFYLGKEFDPLQVLELLEEKFSKVEFADHVI